MSERRPNHSDLIRLTEQEYGDSCGNGSFEVLDSDNILCFGPHVEDNIPETNKLAWIDLGKRGVRLGSMDDIVRARSYVNISTRDGRVK